MKRNKKIKSALESLNDILKRIGPYIPETPEGGKRKEKPWKMAKDVSSPYIPRHNQATSPF